MKTKLLLCAFLCASPILSMAGDFQIDLGGLRIQAPGVTVTFGSRDSRGYYWDGEKYRDPDFWREHEGDRGERHYTGRERDGDHHKGESHFCPPGQAKKGNC